MVDLGQIPAALLLCPFEKRDNSLVTELRLPMSSPGATFGSPKVRAKQHYDKFTYAVKRRPEDATPSPSGSPSRHRDAAATKAPGALTLNRDGFAIDESGFLMSRVVSPPRYTWRHGASGVFGATHPTVTVVPAAQGSGTYAVAGGSAVASVVGTSRSNSAVGGGSSHPDPWGALVTAAAPDLSEAEVAILSWDTLLGLLQHYGLAHNKLDVAKVNLVWKKKQKELGNDAGSEVPSSVPAAAGGDHSAAAADATLLVCAAPPARAASPSSDPALRTAPIQQIAYGRPQSPRRGGRFTPDRHKKTQWTSGPKIDTGRHKKVAAAAA